MYHILIIDDEKEILLMAAMFLTQFGFEVETASNGIEGIKKFSRGRYDLVITDMVMPGLNGHQVVKYIRNSKRQSTPIIGISGTPGLLNDDDFEAVLEKPFDMTALIDAVNKLSVTDSAGRRP